MPVFQVLTLNRIAAEGLARLPADRYAVSGEAADPDAILVRSAGMHQMPFGPSLKAVGRAGAGVNNIPIAALSARGVPVFNTPGANANAVKELVMVGLVIGCRQLCHAWDFARSLQGTDDEVARTIEKEKGRFVGTELPGRTLGVLGLGAIGRLVANAGVALGMHVVGFDPGLTVDGAWQLSSAVVKAWSIEEVLRVSDFVTVHVPLSEATRHLINADRIRMMRPNVVLLNFARSGIVDDQAVVEAIDARRIASYVCDFPSNITARHPGVVALPHLGASTHEAETNCAVMIADQIRAFLEDGCIRNSVNFPEVVAPRETPHRLICANANVPNMLSQISDALGRAGLNIHAMVNHSRGELAYTVVDLDAPVPESVAGQIRAIDGVLMARSVDRAASVSA
jgi:D-3-phosphoglycerate dehydrogenase